MINLFVRYTAGVAFAVLLSSCGGKPESSLESATPTATVAPDPNLLTSAAIDPETASALKDSIAKSGGQCNHIVSAEGEDFSSKIKVTCTEQVGDSNTVSYTVDPGI